MLQKIMCSVELSRCDFDFIRNVDEKCRNRRPHSVQSQGLLGQMQTRLKLNRVKCIYSDRTSDELTYLMLSSVLLMHLFERGFQTCEVTGTVFSMELPEDKYL